MDSIMPVFWGIKEVTEKIICPKNKNTTKIPTQDGRREHSIKIKW